MVARQRLGAYAAGTVAGSLTRRYHGLLMAPVNPPLGRFLVFAKADATLIDGTREWPLFTNRWGGGTVVAGRLPPPRVVPAGRTHAGMAFRGRRCHRGAAHLDGAGREHHLRRLASANRCCRTTARPRQLRVKLLVNARDHHGNARPWDFDPVIEQDHNAADAFAPQRVQGLCADASGGSLHTRTRLVRELRSRPEQRARSERPRQSSMRRPRRRFELVAGDWVGVVAGLDENASPYLKEAMRRFIAHDQGVLKRAQNQHPELLDAPDWVSQLVLAADSFVFSRPLPDVPDGESVIAGYPWFGDWGRDTMIALPGLTLATGRFDSARRILDTFARFVDRGMLPNVFPGAGGHADYNTVDAALWYVEAWRAWFEATGDRATLARAYPVLRIHRRLALPRHALRHRPGRGRRSAVRRRAGRADDLDGCQDRRLGGDAAHRQAGRNQRALVQRAAQHGGVRPNAGRTTRPLTTGSRRRRAPGFARFVKPDGGLLDVLDGPDGDDGSVRPNQIFAVSLPHSPLQPDQRARVVDECARELLGSYGLRSLAADDPDYRGALRRRRLGTRRRLSPGTAVGLAARTLRAGADRVTAMPPRRSACWNRSAITCWTPGWARSARFSTATLRTRRAAHRRRPGRWPAYWKPGGGWNARGARRPSATRIGGRVRRTDTDHRTPNQHREDST